MDRCDDRYRRSFYGSSEWLHRLQLPLAKRRFQVLDHALDIRQAQHARCALERMGVRSAVSVSPWPSTRRSRSISSCMAVGNDVQQPNSALRVAAYRFPWLAESDLMPQALADAGPAAQPPVRDKADE